ncbi:hypothetical protein CTI12_AA497690 [Artemisia annua]|uniref:Uncharacterized protein n=1 Tax=Artemisia annua TaxID=35608 RepID=A0A2U1LF45_ARTAN|nr:hypothetical protein CTI12_AA497690 [Artemisia annua]
MARKMIRDTFCATHGQDPCKRLAQSHSSRNPLKKPKSIVNVGYGIGGSSKYLSRKIGAKCYGVTMSHVQVDKAHVLAAAQGLANMLLRLVVDAMRQTVTNMIGTLPPQVFAVTLTTVAENLAQLMYSVLMTGYMFRNAQYRFELQQSLEQVALPVSEEKKECK